jgi:RNA polymerase sigma-70 factor (ECF subfamily)
VEQLLVERAKRGDRGAFEQIYRRHRDYMLTIALHLTGRSAWAEDVVQDVFASFIDSLGSFELRGSLKPYFSVCVANRARDILRKCKIRKSESLDGTGDVASSKPGPLTLTIQDEEIERIKEAFDTLPYDQREVIILRTHGGMAFREIAQALDIPLTTAHSRWQYGLDKLRTFVKEVDNA